MSRGSSRGSTGGGEEFPFLDDPDGQRRRSKRRDDSFRKHGGGKGSRQSRYAEGFDRDDELGGPRWRSLDVADDLDDLDDEDLETDSDWGAEVDVDDDDADNDDVANEEEDEWE